MSSGNGSRRQPRFAEETKEEKKERLRKERAKKRRLASR